MSNGNGVLPLALGAGGGFFLWYFLRDGKHVAHSPAPSAPIASPTACVLRLDAAGLTADGARVGVADAVSRCKLAGRADVTVTEEAAATAYADLMVALGRAGVPVYSHRNGAGPRNAKRRTGGDVDLPTFVEAVRSLASHIEPDPTPSGSARGRFSDRKVFIAAIRRALRATDYARLPRATVDELLLRAHREGLLQFARADLVAAMDPDEVRDSEVTHPTGARFHFVVVEREAKE